jgi:hypothetical protein
MNMRRSNRSGNYTSGRRDNYNQYRDRYGRFERSHTPHNYYDGYQNRSDRRNYGQSGGNFYGQGNNYSREHAGFSGLRRGHADWRDHDRGYNGSSDRAYNGSSDRWNMRDNGRHDDHYYDRNRRSFSDNWTDRDEDTNYRRDYDYENSYEEDRGYRYQDDDRGYDRSYNHDNRRRNWQENDAW